MTEIFTFTYGFGQTTTESITEWNLDDKGRKIKGIVTQNDDGETLINEYTYDKQGNRTKFVQRQSNGDIVYVWETSYDSKGNITREIQMKQNETLLDLQWVYDDIGNVIKYISPTSTIEYKYYGRQVFYEQ